MQRLSVKVSENLYRNLLLQSQTRDISLSSLMREYLEIGLKQAQSAEPEHPPTSQKEVILQKRIATHTLFTYCLLEHFVKTTQANGERLCEVAESRAEKLAVAMLQKVND